MATSGCMHAQACRDAWRRGICACPVWGGRGAKLPPCADLTCAARPQPQVDLGMGERTARIRIVVLGRQVQAGS